MPKDTLYVRRFDTLNADDVTLVGGKNVLLREMRHALKSKQIRVPEGYSHRTCVLDVPGGPSADGFDSRSTCRVSRRGRHGLDLTQP